MNSAALMGRTIIGGLGTKKSERVSTETQREFLFNPLKEFVEFFNLFVLLLVKIIKIT